MSLSSLLHTRADLIAYVPAAVTTTVAAMAGRDRVHLGLLVHGLRDDA